MPPIETLQAYRFPGPGLRQLISQTVPDGAAGREWPCTRQPETVVPNCQAVMTNYPPPSPGSPARDAEETAITGSMIADVPLH